MGVHSIPLLIVLISSLSVCMGQSGGSKCPGTSCTPSPYGSSCDPRYERDDGCCPVWYCTDGTTVYGKSSSGSSSSSSWSSSSSSSGAGMPGMPAFPGFNIQLPFFGRR